MTMTTSVRGRGPDPEAPWPPSSCPPWCRDSAVHEASDELGIRYHDDGSDVFVELSAPGTAEELDNWINVALQQAAGRSAEVVVSLWGETKVCLTRDDALELSHRIKSAVDRIGVPA